VAATVLVGVAIALCVELLGNAALQRRATADRQLAAQEAANLLERLSAMPLDELRSEKAKKLPLSPEGQRLAGVQSEIEVVDVDETPKGVQIVVSIRWEDRTGQTLPPVRLVAWRYR
jgi:hypothetical protein